MYDLTRAIVFNPLPPPPPPPPPPLRGFSGVSISTPFDLLDSEGVEKHWHFSVRVKKITLLYFWTGKFCLNSSTGVGEKECLLFSNIYISLHMQYISQVSSNMWLGSGIALADVYLSRPDILLSWADKFPRSSCWTTCLSNMILRKSTNCGMSQNFRITTPPTFFYYPSHFHWWIPTVASV